MRPRRASGLRVREPGAALQFGKEWLLTRGTPRRLPLWRWLLAGLAVFGGPLTTGLDAQNVTPAADIPGAAAQPAQGFQIRSVSAYGAYYSSGAPATTQPTVGSSGLSGDAGYGGSVEFDWRRFTERTTFNLTYTPSYTAQFQYSTLDSVDHALAVSLSRRVTPRWTFDFSVSATVTTLAESEFSPTALSQVASVPSSYQDLANALLQSQFGSNPQLGAALTTAQVTQSPLNTLLYGQRMFSGAFRTALSYSYSPRLKFISEFDGLRTQYLSVDRSGGAFNTGLGLTSTAGRASLGFSYSLSPQTEIGASIASIRTISPQYDEYVSSSQVTLSRKVSNRWILQGRAGAGVTNAVRSVGGRVPVKPYPSAGGSLVYKTQAHTFMGSVDRTVSNTFGVGANTAFTANAAWKWRLPGRPWWVDSAIGWQQLSGGGLAPTSGWHVTAAFNQAISAHVALRAEYSYLNYSGGLENSTLNFSESAIRVSILWAPPANAFR